MSMITLISKLLPIFFTSDKGASTSSRHLIITRQAIIIILSIISTIGAITLILKCLGRGSHYVTTHHNLSSCITTDMGVHLIQLIAESVKISIHAHKLCHYGLQCHSTHWRRRSRGGWSDRSWRCDHLHLRLPWAKLCKTSLNSSGINGTHECEVGRLGVEDKKVANESHDNGRKNELITSQRVLIDIHKGEYKVWRKVNRDILNRGQQKSSTKLCDSVIMRQWMKNKCHHHV